MNKLKKQFWIAIVLINIFFTNSVELSALSISSSFQNSQFVSVVNTAAKVVNEELKIDTANGKEGILENGINKIKKGFKSLLSRTNGNLIKKLGKYSLLSFGLIAVMYCVQGVDGKETKSIGFTGLNIAEKPDKIFSNANELSPVLVNPISDMGANISSDFSYAIPQDTFIDPDGDSLIYTAKLNNGSDLPEWLNFDLTPVLASRYDGIHDGKCVVVDNKKTYAGGGSFVIIDFKEFDNPVLLGEYTDIPGKINDIFVKDNFAYLATESDVEIMNVSDPANIQLLGTYSISGKAAAKDVCIKDDIAYIAADSQGLEIVDVSNPLTPCFLGRYKSSNDVISVSTQGNITCILDSCDGLKVIDVSNPSKPELLGNYTINVNNYQLLMQDNIVFVTDYKGILHIIDIHNPFNPTLISTFDLEFSTGMYIQDNFFYISGFGTLSIIDISNKSEPVLLKKYIIPEHFFMLSSNDIFVKGKMATVVGDDSLYVIDVSNWKFSGNPGEDDSGQLNIILTADDRKGGKTSDSFILNAHNFPILSKSIPVQGAQIGEEYIFIVPSDTFIEPLHGCILTYNASLVNEEALPEWLTFNSDAKTFSGIPQKSDTGKYLIKITVDDGKQGTSDCIFELNVEDFPVPKKHISNKSAYAGIKFNFQIPENTFTNPGGNLLTYTGSLSNDSELPSWLNLSLSPKALGIYYTNKYENTYSVFIKNNIAYFLSGGRLYIIDVSNPENPRRLSSFFQDGFIVDACVQEKIVYLIDEWYGLTMLDVTNPSNPEILSHYLLYTGSMESLFVEDNKAYVTESGNQFTIIDVADPLNPVRLGRYLSGTTGVIHDIFVHENIAYLADLELDGHLEIVNVSNPMVPLLLSIFDTSEASRGIFVQDKKAYVVGNYGLKIIDVYNPLSPELLGSYNIKGDSKDIYVDGKIAYITNSDTSLYIIDISNPSNPLILADYNTPSSGEGIYVKNNTAYLASDNLYLLKMDTWKFRGNPIQGGHGKYKI